MPLIPCGHAQHLNPPALVGKVDARSLRVGVLLGAIAVLNGLDLLYTLFAQNIGMLHEMNPFTAVFLRNGLYSSLVCFKILMVLGGLSILWKMRRSRLAIPACWVLLVAYVVLGFVWVQWVWTVNNNFELRLSSAMP
jgi:hypothetical protein